jgi:PAS domain-containing protein
MGYISSHFTGTTATSPLELPPDVASSLKSNVKFSARTAIPALDKVYQEAKATVETRLSQNLYPEFVKYQLSQRLTAALSTHHTLPGEVTTPYPGLGDAFCLTDPLRPDNPVVFVSDGLLAMSGFQRRELIGRNCRLLQGLATEPEAAWRLSRAVSSGREVTDLVLNYRPDGTPYWNFLFICPLMENGSMRYFLGAQVNISENMGPEYKDILDVLNFGPPPEDQSLEPPTSPIWSSRQSSDNQPPDQEDDEDEKPPLVAVASSGASTANQPPPAPHLLPGRAPHPDQAPTT